MSIIPVAAFFQCHKQPTATYYSLFRFRKAYPTSTIVLLSDNGYNYTKMAKHFNCKYIHSNDNLGVAFGPNKQVKDITRFFEYLDRLKYALSFISEKFFMWLEDDVYVKLPYTETFNGTINGNCFNHVFSSMLKNIDYYKGDTSQKYMSGHGGSIYNRVEFLDILNKSDEINWLVNNWSKILAENTPTIDNDRFFCLAVWTLGGSVMPLYQHKDGMIHHNSAHVCHQCKEFYNVEPDTFIKTLYDSN